MNRITPFSNITQAPPIMVEAYCEKADAYTDWRYLDTIFIKPKILMIYRCKHCNTGRPFSELEVKTEEI